MPDATVIDGRDRLTIHRSETDRLSHRGLSVSVFGAGPTGALLALGLAQAGCRVVLHDPQDPESLVARSRAYAITHSSRRLLERLNLWHEVRSHLVPFDRLRLQDQGVRPVVWFTVDDLNAVNRHTDAIGWILDHKPLMALLLERLGQAPTVSLQLGGATGAALPASADDPPADLLVAADGPRSSHRQSWGLPFWSGRYRQGCLTMKVLLRGGEASTAHEFFRTEGPFAVLPLGGMHYQVVWSAPLERCRERAALAPAVLLDRLATVLPAGLIPDALLDQPMAFPLELSLAPRLGRGRHLLVGEAGHRCHPVGGQGLNLCWRDVSDLLDLIQRHHAESGPIRRLVRRYNRRRLPDLVLIGLGTDALLRLFSNRWRPLLPLRALALQLLRGIPLTRRLALQAMTDGPMTILRSAPE